MDFAGKPFKYHPKTIYPFAVINSYAKNFRSLEKKMHKKVQDGALGIISQPVFDIENAKKLLTSFELAKSEFNDERAKSELILGLFPITRLRTAQFLSAHVPGIYVPQEWIDKFYKASKIGEDEEKKVGMDLSVKLLNDIQKLHPKVHLMTANRFDIADELLS